MVSDVSLGTGVWLWSNQVDVPPTSKQIRTDSGDWVAASQLYISDIDNNNANRGAGIETLKAGDLVRLEHNTDTTRFVLYTVSAAPVPDGAGVYHTVAVTFEDGGGTIPNSSTLIQLVAVSALVSGPEIGHMYINLTLNSQINETMVNDMMRNIADNLQMITHLVNFAEFEANVGGEILIYSKEIKSAIIGDLVPTPQWLETGEQTVNA